MNFLELVKARYSVRNYEERPIEQNKLDYIMECVRLAPSAVNFQPWKFAVITEKKLLEALKSAYPREWIKTAPCIIVACGDHNVAWHLPELFRGLRLYDVRLPRLYTGQRKHGAFRHQPSH